MRRRSCRRKSTPLAYRSWVTHLLHALMRPPVLTEGKMSGEVVMDAPVMTSRIKGVSGTMCGLPVLECSSRTTIRSARMSRLRSIWASSPRRSPVEQG